MQPDPDGRDLLVHQLSDFLTGYLFDLEEDERGSVLFAHPIENPIHRRARFFAFQVVAGQRRVRWKLSHQIVVVAARKDASQPKSPQSMSHLILRNAKQPGRDLGFAAKLGKQSMRGQKDVLHHVLDIDRWTPEPSGPPRNVRRMKPVDLCNRGYDGRTGGK